MKKIQKYFLGILIIISVALTKPLVIKNIRPNKPGHFMYGGIPERNFFVQKELPDSLELKWTAETEGGFSFSSVVIYDTMIVAADLAGGICAIGNSQGKIIGKEKYKGSICSAPILNSFRVMYVVNEFDESYSTLMFYDFVQGKILSSEIIEDKCTNEMILLDDGVLLLTENGRLLKLNLVAYKEWEIATNAISLGDPAASGNIVVWGNKDGEFIAVDISAKKILYRNKICNRFRGGVTISDNNAFIADANGTVYKIEIKTGNILWKYKSDIGIYSTPVTDDKTVYCGNLRGDVFALCKETGKIKWDTATKGNINAAPLVFENVLIQPDVNKKVHLINKGNGKIIKVMDFESRVKMSPVFYNNTIYFGIDDNKIKAYQLIESN